MIILRRFSLVSFVGSALLAVGCGDPSDAEAPSEAAPIVWSQCSLVSDADDGGAECTDVRVPLDWEHPEAGAITVFVKRKLGATPGGPQLWMLPGGPATPAAVFEVPLKQLSPLIGDFDVYLMDIRGTGRSGRLGCPDQEVSPGEDPITEAEWPACIDWLAQHEGDRLGYYTFTNIARDLGAIIEATRAPGQDVHVYAASADTMTAQRYLQLFPEQPTSVTLDGLCQTGKCSAMRVTHDGVGRELLSACGADAFCSAKLGDDPIGAAFSLFEHLDQGVCAPLAAAGFDRPLVQRMFGALLPDFYMRVAIPAIVYRAERCAEADVAALQHLRDVLTTAPTADAVTRGASSVLLEHLLLSELTGDDVPSLAEVEATEAASLLSMGGRVFQRGLYDLWPRYAADTYFGRYPETSVPMLLMNGTLDPQTTIESAREIAGHYTGPQQTFVELPRASHGVLAQSPVSGGLVSCGLQMWLGFLRDVAAPVDTSCLDRIEPLGFEGNATLADTLMGTSDLWENAD